MKRVRSRLSLFLALALTMSVAAGCDSTTTDEFDDFEGSWEVVQFEVADDDGDFSGFFSVLQNEYSHADGESAVTFSFLGSDGDERFSIRAPARNGEGAQRLNVSGDVDFYSGNNIYFIGNFAGQNVQADYDFSDDQLILTTENVTDGESLLDTLIPNWGASPDEPFVRLTLEKS